MLQSVRNLFFRPHNNLSVSDRLVAHAARERDNAGYNLADYQLSVGESRETFHVSVLASLTKQVRDLAIVHKLLVARKENGSSALEPDQRKFLREHLYLLGPLERRTQVQLQLRGAHGDQSPGSNAQQPPAPKASVPVGPSHQATVATFSGDI